MYPRSIPKGRFFIFFRVIQKASENSPIEIPPKSRFSVNNQHGGKEINFPPSLGTTGAAAIPSVLPLPLPGPSVARARLPVRYLGNIGRFRPFLPFQLLGCFIARLGLDFRMRMRSPPLFFATIPPVTANGPLVEEDVCTAATANSWRNPPSHLTTDCLYCMYIRYDGSLPSTLGAVVLAVTQSPTLI